MAGFASMVDRLPSQARVVIIGGGIVGCSVAYHLTKLGWADVLLLERKRLTSGTTWHAAGLVGQLRATMNLTRLAKHTADLLPKLEAETGQATGFRRTGSLSLARTPERHEYYRRSMAAAASFGVEMHEIAPAEIRRHWPLMEVEDLAGAFFIPGDGQTNPTDTTQALAKGARMGGAQIREGVEVTGIRVERGRVTGVSTALGDIAAEYVVNCAGMWARQVGRMAGVSVPLHAAEHMYIVTRPMEGVIRGAPSVRDPDSYIYIKEEVGGLVLGGFEPVAKPWGMDGIRARELHPRHPPHRRRSTRGGELLRRRRLQLDRHPDLRRRRLGLGGMDRRRQADHGLVRYRHPPLPPVPLEQALSPGSHA